MTKSPAAASAARSATRPGPESAGTGDGELTPTTVDEDDDVQPDGKRATTLYVPAMARVAFGIVGFWKLEVKPFGPVHE
jgi:hypothetical protein